MTLNPYQRNKNERRSAVWGKRVMLSMSFLLLASLSVGQAAVDATGTLGKLAPELRTLATQERSTHSVKNVRVIVQFKQAPTQHHFDRVQARGGRLSSRLELVQSGAFSLPASALEDLASDDEVASISIDHPLKGMDDFTDYAVEIASTWSAGYNGSGIGVAIIDSGVNDTNTDLKTLSNSSSRVVYHQDFTGTATVSSGVAVWDLYGHGTHVAGIVGANGAQSNGQYAGLAPNVNLIDLKVLDQNGNGTDSMVIAAIQRAIALKSTYNIRVINLSLGRGVFTSYVNDPLCQAVESAWRSGIVVVVAAGNYGRVNVDGINGYGTITAPGNDPMVITVGAMKTMDTYARTDDRIASYSSKGPSTIDHVVKPDLVAPGNLVVSTADAGSALATQYPGNLVIGSVSSKPSYFRLSGTSMATPVVSAAAALLLNQNSALTPDQIKARLMKTAYKTFPASSVATDPTTGATYTSYYDVFTIGAGYLDMAAALANTDKAPSTVGSAQSPSVAVNANGKVSLVVPSSVIWGTSVLWGTSVIWGTNVNGNSVVWGANVSPNSVVWGTNTLQGYSVVWGSSSTSANSVLWGSSTALDQAALVSFVGEQ